MSRSPHGIVVSGRGVEASPCRSRSRTRPLVEDIDQKMLASIDHKRAFFLGIPRMNPALRRAMRDDYFAHVYHTVAIEGNTMNFIQTRWEL